MASPTEVREHAGFVERLDLGVTQSQLSSARILVAVSGGADSVALLRGLLLLRETRHFELQVGHLNHQLRGAASDSDAEWVRTLSRQLGVTAHIESRSVSTMAEIPRQGLEGTARIARRQFLQQIAIEHSCTHIALAHTADDQVETILHHILRGTGLRGLAGMQVTDAAALPDSEVLSDQVTRSVIPFTRPMLAIPRQQVEAFLANLGQDYRTDDTNFDTQLTRNRIRHELLPQLERDFNPQVRQAILRLAQQANDVHADESELAHLVLQEALIDVSPRHCRLLCGPFRDQSPHRIRECFVRLWRRQNWPRQHMGFRDWNRLIELLNQESGVILLPGQIQVSRRQDLLIIQSMRKS